MSSKQLRRLAVVLGVVLLIWGAVALTSRSAGRHETNPFLPKIDTAAVDTISLSKPRDTAVIARVGKHEWRVNGYPADTTIVNQVLKALADTGTSSELIAQHASSYAQLGLTADSGRRIRIVGRDGQVIANFIVGKETSEHGGIYARRANEPTAYALRGKLSNALPKSGEAFRDRQIAAVPSDSVAKIEVWRGSRSYTLMRGTTTWTFASGAATDSASVAHLLSYYHKLNAMGFGTPAQEDSLHFATPKWRTRLLTRSGAPLVSLVCDSIASGFWVRHDSGGPAYRLDTWTARRLAPADSGLRKKS